MLESKISVFFLGKLAQNAKLYRSLFFSMQDERSLQLYKDPRYSAHLTIGQIKSEDNENEYEYFRCFLLNPKSFKVDKPNYVAAKVTAYTVLYYCTCYK